MFRKLVFLLLASVTFSVAMAQLKPVKGYPIGQKVNSYKTVKLTADVSHLDHHLQMVLRNFIQGAKAADEIFWMQSYGNKNTLLNGIKADSVKKFVMLNYGPWDRLNNDTPFIAGVGLKPKGAGFYPQKMTEKEFNDWKNPNKNDPYSVVIRNPKTKGLEVVPYAVAYPQQIGIIQSQLFMSIGEVFQLNQPQHGVMVDQGDFSQSDTFKFAEYLRLRAEAMRGTKDKLNDFGYYNKKFIESDIAWLKVKNFPIDIIIGPIENYEDKLFGKRTAFEAYVLVRDQSWSAKLAKFNSFLPDLQKNLPVEANYKAETPGLQGSLAVFDAVYYAGDCNSGSKTIAVNLPNDEEVQKTYGTRKTQIKNVMLAKFENIVKPISEVLIDPSQRKYINGDAFFNDVMFHEVAHSLGIKNVVGNAKTVRDALGANYSAIEECKADVLGLWMVTQMVDKKELDLELANYYITFVASTIRSVRFGASSAHGKANMITFNRLIEDGALTRSSAGLYTVNVEKMRTTITKLAGELLMLQGNGDAVAVENLLNTKAVVSASLQADIKNLQSKNIPVDLVFEQGVENIKFSK